MVRQVLVPLDGSDRAEAVLPWAALLARLTAAEIILLRVVPSGTESDDEAARADLAAIADQVLASRVPVRPEVVSGQPVEQILAAAPTAGLIAMTTRGRTGLGRWLLGSVADAVVRGAGVPVLLVTAAVPPPVAPTLRRLVVALDGSARAARALPPAAALARQAGSGLVLAGTWAWEAPLPSNYTRATEVMRLSARWDRRARRALEPVAAGLRDGGLTVGVDRRQGEPATVLLAMAAEHEADLIFVAVPETGLGEARVGAVAEAVVRGARVPVVLVPVARRDGGEDL
jgi:nucleotide-binding universal stress UspA family protein